MRYTAYCYVFFFNDTATTEIYTLSLHDALPISNSQAHSSKGTPSPTPQRGRALTDCRHMVSGTISLPARGTFHLDRKSTRLNSSHANISYAVFCLKKKKPISLIHTNVFM